MDDLEKREVEITKEANRISYLILKNNDLVCEETLTIQIFEELINTDIFDLLVLDFGNNSEAYSYANEIAYKTALNYLS
jgi:hypothetical protein